MIRTRYFLGLPFVTLKIGNLEIEAVLDTGFNGSLLLPENIIQNLQFKAIGSAEYAMADGTLSESKVFSVEIDWLGGRKKVSVVSSESDLSLVGMELLYDIQTMLHPAKNILKMTPA